MITLQILFPLAIIKYMRFLIKGQSKFGSSLLLPAYGRVGQRQYFLAAHFAKRNTKNCGGEKARAGREFLSPQPPFLPAPPERKNFLLCRAKRGDQNSKFGFSSKKVRILSKRYRQHTFLSVSTLLLEERGRPESIKR